MLVVVAVAVAAVVVVRLGRTRARHVTCDEGTWTAVLGCEPELCVVISRARSWRRV